MSLSFYEKDLEQDDSAAIVKNCQDDDPEMYESKELCLLEDDDLQCGHIFYNKFTRVLKFFCTYCKETYDNINFYCEHLSTHINDEDVAAEDEEVDGDLDAMGHISPAIDEAEDELPAEIPVERGEIATVEKLYYEHSPTTQAREKAAYPVEDEEKEKEAAATNVSQHDDASEDNQENLTSTGDPEDVDGVMDESGELKDDEDDNEDSILKHSESDIDNCLSEEEFADYEVEGEAAPEASMASTSNASTPATADVMDFESMITATNIKGNLIAAQTVDPPRQKKRGKKVTTVKVIAVKNRIAELYEKIKSEEEKRSGMRAFDVVQADGSIILAGNSTAGKHDGEPPHADSEHIIDPGECSSSSPNAGNVTRKVIGETVITLMPRPQSTATLTTNDHQSLNTPSNAVALANSSSPSAAASEKAKSKEKVCPACGMTFRSSFSLTIHKRSHYLESNSEVKLAHKCSDCDRLFNKISEMKVHLERVHYPEGYICKICQKKLSSLTLLEKHMRLVHLNKPFSCQVCQKSFETRTLFESHIDSHIEGRNYKCEICGRRYGTELSMKHHMRRHKQQVPQCCVVCGKMTLRITQHMKIHTPRPKRVLSCKACGKIFNFSSGLSHHFKIMHKMPRPPPKPKKPQPANARPRRPRRPRLAKTAKSVQHQTEERLHHMPSKQHMGVEEMISHAADDQHEEQVLEQHELELEQEQQHQAHLLQIDHEHIQRHHAAVMQQQPPAGQHFVLRQQEEQQREQLLHDVNLKEEEAKRVIVELIQNATYTSFLPEHHMNEFEVAPPIAREETISAVNSIVNDC